MKRILLCTLALLFLASEGGAQTVYNNYQHLIGARGASMGGAFTALADDSSALWYNPAGLARVKTPTLNVAANSYNYYKQDISGYNEFQRADGSYDSLDVSFEDYSVVANTLSYAMRVGEKSAIAAGLFVPYQSSLTAQGKVVTTGPTMLIDADVQLVLNEKFYMGMLGFGTQLFDWLNIGVSACYGLNRYNLEIQTNVLLSLLPLPPASNILFTTDQRTVREQQTLHGGLGAQILLGGGNSIGIYGQTPAFRVSGRVKEEIKSKSSIAGMTVTSDREPLKDEIGGRVLPGFLSIGYGYERTNSWGVSIEAVPVFTSETNDNAVINFKAGFEFFLAETLILRGGFFTDFSQMDDVTVKSRNKEQWDYYGGTVSMVIGKAIGGGADSRPSMSWTTIGVVQRLGYGKMQLYRADETMSQTKRVKEETQSSISVFIAETISF